MPPSRWRKVRHHVGGLKLGLEFFCAHGHHGVHEIAKIGLPIFLDLKLHDIPNTVAAAMQAIHVLEPAIVHDPRIGRPGECWSGAKAQAAARPIVAVTWPVDARSRPHDRRRRQRRSRSSAWPPPLPSLERTCRPVGARGEGGAQGVAGRLFRRPRRPPRQRHRRRSETRRHPGAGAGRRRLDLGRRPPDQPVGRPRPRGAGDRGDALIQTPFSRSCRAKSRHREGLC